MPFVLDASIALCWAFEEESDARADRALERMRADTACVPAIWWFEVRHALLVCERRGRLSEAESVAFLHMLARLRVVVDRSPEDAAVLSLARRHRLTVYDAAYLELAQRQGLELATLDEALAGAARAESLGVLAAEGGAGPGVG